MPACDSGLFFRDRYRLDHVGRNAGAGLRASDGVHHIHALDHSTENGMQAVQPLGGTKRNKKLTAVRVRTRIRHGEQARLVEDEIIAEFILKE